MEALLCMGVMFGLPILGLIFATILNEEKSKVRELESKLSNMRLLSNDEEQMRHHVQMSENKYNKTLQDISSLEGKAQEIRNKIKELDDEESKSKRELQEARRNVTIATNELSNLEAKADKKRNEISNIEDEGYIKSFNLYQPRYDFPESSHYSRRLDEIRNEQSALIKEKKAVICFKEWAIEGSRQKGQKMINDIIRLMLIAFNGECDALISKVKYSNVDSIEKKISKIYDVINQMMAGFNCEITKQFYNLRIQELFLVHEYQEKRQEEKEEQQRIKEQIREEAALEREIERQLKESERDEEKFEKLLEKARKDMANAAAEAQAFMTLKIQELEQQLQEAHERSQRALSMAQQTKAGHVYVISNIGSFGPDVVKIGMTRRLEPMDRVKELGDASVPFAFDVHAMIYTEDAPALENALHKAFAAHRVNRVNLRKEYFRVSLEAVEQHVAQHMPEAEFTRLAEAGEYRRSLAFDVPFSTNPQG
jgi:predicted RNase H-like nuclease (RuvC/YqgF family)